MAFDNRNRGFLVRNTRRQEGTRQPEYSGSIDVNGKSYWLSAWVNESKAGKKYFALSIKPAEAKGRFETDIDNQPQRANGKDSDDIAF